MSENAAAEDAAAAFACLCAGCTGAAISYVQASNVAANTNRRCQSPTTDVDNKTSIKISNHVILAATWSLCVLILSIPSVLWVVGTSVPGGDNTMGISTAILEILQHAIAGVLYIITAFIIPPLANACVEMCRGEADRTTALALMMGGRLVIVLLAPFGAVVWLNEMCCSNWDKFFSENVASRSSASFCSRAVVTSLGTLIIQKLLFGVFLHAPLMLLSYTARCQRGKQWLVRTVCNKKDYTPTKSIDREIASVWVMLEYPIVLGTCIPVLIPLACANLAQSALAFSFARRHLGMELSNQAQPSHVYLWVSLVLGLMFTSWFFLDCNLHGQYLVFLGTPLCAVFGAWLCRLWLRCQSKDLDTLSETFNSLNMAVDSELGSNNNGSDPTSREDALLVHVVQELDAPGSSVGGEAV